MDISVPDIDKESRNSPGLQRERTVLAWTRTTLAVAAVSLLALHLDSSIGSVLVSAGGLVCSAALMLGSGVRRARPRRRHDPNWAEGLVGFAATSTIGLAVASIVLVLLPT